MFVPPVNETTRPDFGTTQIAMLSGWLAQNWRLPVEICQAIRHHHDQPAIDHLEFGMPLASRYLVAGSQTAEHIPQQLTGGSQTMEWAKLGPSCLRLPGLDKAGLAETYVAAEDPLKNTD